MKKNGSIRAPAGSATGLTGRCRGRSGAGEEGASSCTVLQRGVMRWGVRCVVGRYWHPHGALRDKQGRETLGGKKQEHLFAKAYTFQSTDTVLVSSLKYAAQNKGNTKKGERASNSRLQERM